MADNFSLKVFMENETTVHIEGNEEGLKYLSEICLEVVGQPPGPNHYHLSDAMNNLDPGKYELIVCYRKDLE